jgi:hypothetical protein
MATTQEPAKESELQNGVTEGGAQVPAGIYPVYVVAITTFSGKSVPDANLSLMFD